MKKRTGKILVSAFCICALLAGSIFQKSMPETLAEDHTFDASEYDVMTFYDFGFSDGTILKDTVYGTNYRDNLDKVALVGTITTETGYMRYGGSDAEGGVNSWTALQIDVRDGELVVTDVVNTGNGAATFTAPSLKQGEAFHLTFTTDYVDSDADNEIDDLEVQVWIDDVYAGSHVFTNTAAKVKPNLLISANTGTGTFTIVSDDLTAGYEKLTFGSFGITDGTYNDSNTPLGQYNATEGESTLDGKLLVSDITLHENGSEIRFGGTNTLGYSGVRWWLTVAGDHCLSFLKEGDIFTNIYGMGTATEYQVIPGTVGLEAGESVPIQMGFRILDLDGDGAKDDIKLQLYLRGEFYTDFGIRDAASSLGNYARIASAADVTVATPAGTVTSDEVAQKTPEELGYERVTLADFGIADGTYSKTEVMMYGTYTASSSLDKKYLDVNITLGTGEVNAGGTALNFAGNLEGGWLGIRMFKTETYLGFVSTTDVTDVKQYSYGTLGIDDHTEPFNLKLGVQLDGENVRVDLWVDNVRQKSMTFYGAASQFGNNAGIYVLNEPITVSTTGGTGNATTPENPGKSNEKKKKLNSDFRQMTFANYKIEDGTYACKNGEYAFEEGRYGLGMNETVFSGRLLFSSAVGTDFRFGGQVDGWHGLRFWNQGGRLYMADVNGYTDTYTFEAAVAGVELEDNLFLLQLSTEYVDKDKDEQKDDVKLGVWFEGVLYQNTYIYLINYKQYLGRYIGVYSATDTTYITVESVEGIQTGVDWTIFGLTDKWRKELNL